MRLHRVQTSIGICGGIGEAAASSWDYVRNCRSKAGTVGRMVEQAVAVCRRDRYGSAVSVDEAAARLSALMPALLCLQKPEETPRLSSTPSAIVMFASVKLARS